MVEKVLIWKLILNPENIRKLYKDYPLAPDKTEIKREMLSRYQLFMADCYNICNSNAKILVLKLF